MRMLEEVLMDPKVRTAPPMRKQRKAKRASKPIVLGNIKSFFTKLNSHKECHKQPNQVVEDGGDDGGLRKRKGACMETAENSLTKKSRSLGSATTSGGQMSTSRTRCPILLGAKSLAGREPDTSLLKGSIGLELMDGGAKKVEWTPAIGWTDVGN